MPYQTVATYNTYLERNGRDPALDALLREPRTLVCLQEVSIHRAWEIKRSFKVRSFVSPLRVRYGLHFLAVVLPEGARFVARRTFHLTSRWGLFPEAWCLRRSYHLYRSGSWWWRNALQPFAAQMGWVLWEGRAFRLVNTHLPWEGGLRPQCLDKLQNLLVRGENILLAGDLNTTTEDVFLANLLRVSGLRPVGPTMDALHGERRMVDHVLLSDGGFREVRCSLEEGLSDHSLLRVELTV